MFFVGLTGAILSYLAVMVVLLVLLALQYVRIRGIISQATGDPFARKGAPTRKRVQQPRR